MNISQPFKDRRVVSQFVGMALENCNSIQAWGNSSRRRFFEGLGNAISTTINLRAVAQNALAGMMQRERFFSKKSGCASRPALGWRNPVWTHTTTARSTAVRRRREDNTREKKRAHRRNLATTSCFWLFSQIRFFLFFFFLSKSHFEMWNYGGGLGWTIIRP